MEQQKSSEMSFVCSSFDGNGYGYDQAIINCLLHKKRIFSLRGLAPATDLKIMDFVDALDMKKTEPSNWATKELQNFVDEKLQKIVEHYKAAIP